MRHDYHGYIGKVWSESGNVNIEVTIYLSQAYAS